jgi:hypothetical protein
MKINKMKEHLIYDLNWLTYCGAFFELYAVYLLGNKKPWGFYSNIAGLICWMSYSLITKKAPGLLVVSIVGIAMNVLASYKWIL